MQATYLAYCGTTGLGAMDYRLTDPHLDPPGENERFYCEQSVRLPETYWCYRPPIATPPIVAPPALAAGHVTFGSLNNFCKVTPPVLAAWGRLLQAVPPRGCSCTPAPAVIVTAFGDSSPSKAFRPTAWNLWISSP